MNTYPSSLPAFLSRHLTKLSPGGLLLVVILAGVTGCSPTPPPKNQIDAALIRMPLTHRIVKYDTRLTTTDINLHTNVNKHHDEKEIKVTCVNDKGARHFTV